MLRLNQKFSDENSISYKEYHKPVYRGMGFDSRFSMDDY